MYFNNLVIALDSSFVHRSRTLEGKDGNPLNEVRLLVNVLVASDGVFTAEKAIKFKPEQSILGLAYGDEIAIREGDFERLAAAFFAEIEAKFAA